MGFAEFDLDGDGRMHLRMPAHLVGPLSSVFDELLGMIEADRPQQAEEQDPLLSMLGIEPDAGVPDDPAIARLFPDAYVGDDEAAQEFRRFTRRAMRDAKLDNLQVLLGSLERAEVRLELSDQESQAWLRGINDARLALASRLGIETEADADRLDVAAGFSAFLYHLLGALQSSLVDALAQDDLAAGLIPDDDFAADLLAPDPPPGHDEGEGVAD